MARNLVGHKVWPHVFDVNAYFPVPRDCDQRQLVRMRKIETKTLRGFRVGKVGLAMVARLDLQTAGLRFQVAAKNQPQRRARDAEFAAIRFKAETVGSGTIFERQSLVKSPRPWDVKPRAPNVNLIRPDHRDFRAAHPGLTAAIRNLRRSETLSIK